MKQEFLTCLESTLEQLESTLKEFEELRCHAWKTYDQAYYEGASEGLSLSIEQIKKILNESKKQEAS